MAQLYEKVRKEFEAQLNYVIDPGKRSDIINEATEKINAMTMDELLLAISDALGELQ